MSVDYEKHYQPLEEKDRPTEEELQAKVDQMIADCGHDCTSNCRRNGCNCECGEFHGQLTIEDLL